MKGRYSGRHMTIYGTVFPGATSIARSALLGERLTKEARYRINILDWHRAHGKNTALTARHFGIGRATMHRWFERYRTRGLLGLNEESRRPKRLRKPTTPPEVTARIVSLRREHPAWSKHKLHVLLKREGVMVSASTIGRILKRRGMIAKKISEKRRRAALHPRARFPHGMRISSPGDMVQMDTKHIMLPGGKRLYQFTAIDVLSKTRVLRVYASESSRNGALFLEECLQGFSFPIRAVQTDNGAPFQKEFEKRSRELNLSHFFTYPRHPKQNTYVEISHGADEREFYRQGNISMLLPVMRERIRVWQDVWNNVRPHEALSYLTPKEYLAKLEQGRMPTRNIITLQT